MSLEKVKCSKCGKEFEVKMSGGANDVEWKKKHWTWLCEECKSKKMNEEMQKAVEQSQEMQLPELVGSEKQVQWAMKIRMQAVEEMKKQFEAVEDPQTEFLMKLGFEDMFKEIKASWWIDNRNMGFGALAIQRGKKVVNELAAKNATQKEVI